VIISRSLLAVGNGFTFGIKAIDQRIERELKSLRVVVETFLKNPEPPTWLPPGNATPSNREFLEAFNYQLIPMATQVFYFMISIDAMVMKSIS
jgi:hypothetical protein